jgi:hypothetical protein
MREKIRLAGPAYCGWADWADDTRWIQALVNTKARHLATFYTVVTANTTASQPAYQQDSVRLDPDILSLITSLHDMY